jgi:hypothetical protein
MLKNFDPQYHAADLFVKERISLIEIGFRKCGEDVATSNAALPGATNAMRERRQRTTGRLVVPGGSDDPAGPTIAANKHVNKLYSDSVAELNERFRQAGSRLHYHNGFIQLTDDALSTERIKAPFWRIDPPFELDVEAFGWISDKALNHRFLDHRQFP